MRQIVLDTETTGLSPEKGHRIIEIGCLEMINRRLTGKHLHYYINPERAVDSTAVEVHGLTNEFLEDKPLFADVVKDIIDFINASELIIHNAPFDVAFMEHEFKLAEIEQFRIEKFCSVVDSLVLARNKHPGQPNSLDALCRRYQVDNSNRQYHGALLDAELLAQVYLLMTGGQVKMFEAPLEITTSQQTRIKRVAAPRKSLKVIKANEMELAAHQQIVSQFEGS